MSLIKKIKPVSQEKKPQSKNSFNIINDRSPFFIREAYKSLRTNIMFSVQNETSKAIIITSSLANEGKSTVAINTSITFAQTGAKVILIDCDLRNSKTHKYINVPKNVGLSNYLGGFSKLSEVTVHTEFGFDCIPAGHIPPNPSELLSSTKMISLINSLKDTYDFIFLDTPPVNVVTDTCTIGKFCDGAIFVTKYNQTTYSDIETALATLKFSETNVLGFVFNSVPVFTGIGKTSKFGIKRFLPYKKYGYGYRYGYGYGYGGYTYSYGPKVTNTTVIPQTKNNDQSE